MRWNPLAAVAVFALSILVTVVVACSDTTKCTPGTLELDIALLSTAPLADRITVTSTDMDVPLDATFPHTPNASTPGVEHTSVNVTFPNGYPADKVVHLLVRAYGGVTVLGANTAAIHLGKSCDTASVAVTGGINPTADMGGTD
jgi:hypothetical protein